MSRRIYLRQSDGTLTPMIESPFAAEDLLQELLEKYPNLLAGDQIDGAEDRRWLLVARELGVPDEEGAPDRWSVDHLFLDQDAVPTLVEVKRSSDTRIRREVVGQLLDYAANAVVFVDRLRATFRGGLRRARPGARGGDRREPRRGRGRRAVLGGRADEPASGARTAGVRGRPD